MLTKSVILYIYHLGQEMNINLVWRKIKIQENFMIQEAHIQYNPNNF